MGSANGLTRREWLAGSLATSGLLFSGCGPTAQTPGSALILTNGKFWTNDPRSPTVSALAIRGGKILATGNAADMRDRLSGARVIDLGGRTVVPGLIDSHTHIVREGRFYTTELRWEAVPSLDRALSMIFEQAKRTPAGQWIRVIGGWSPYQFAERRLPTPKELTRAAPNTPVFVSYLYSRGFLNQAGARALGINEGTNAATPTPGARYEVSPGGVTIFAEPNPALLYQAIAALPALSPGDQLASTKAFYRELNRFGLTGVVDAGGGGHQFPGDYASAEQLARSGELPLRISYTLFPQTPGRELADLTAWTRDYTLNQNLAAALEHGFEIDGAGEYLTFSAGDFENFLAPRPDLADRPGWQAELTAVTRTLLQARWPIRIHATYDESITAILGVFEAAHAAERAEGRPGFGGLRWAIDHAETISPASIARVKRLGGGVAIQDRMAFAGEYFAERYGSEAAGSAPPLRDLIESGIPLGAGTDATRVSSYNPWVAIQWLVTGETVGGTALMSERHRLTVAEAMTVWTSGSAWFAGEAALKGRLAPGRFADLAVLSDDVFATDPRRIGGIESVLTMTGGKVVHGADSFAPLAPAMPPIQPSWSPVATYRAYRPDPLTGGTS